MRTFEELKASVRHAVRSNDAEVLLLDATELDSISTPEAEAMAVLSRGSAHYIRSDYSKALIYFQQGLALYEELSDSSNVAIAIGNIGLLHLSTGDYPAALEHYHRALAIHEELGDRRGVALITGNMGTVHKNTGNYPAALELYNRAQAMHEELGDRHGVARITGNMGTVHKSTGNYSAALELYHRTLAIFEELGDRRGVAIATGNIGIVHLSTGNYPAALEHCRRALTIHEELGNSSGVAQVTGNILAVLISSELYDDADALLQAMDALQIGDPAIVVQREHSRASLQEHHGNIDEARAVLRDALLIAQELTLVPEQAEFHKSLRDLALKQNDLAGYVEHNNDFTRITEEINGKEATLKMAMQEAERKMAKERNEHEKHLAILHSTLPKHIADRVARGEVVNDHYDNASVIFLDIVGFTTLSEQLSSTEVVQLLESVFTRLDDVCRKHDVVKIKTIGDSYMAVAFPQESSSSEQRAARNDNAHVFSSAGTALDMLHAISHIDSPTGSPVEVRLGVHCGAVTAGVIGKERLQYDVWGDTVNVASRMESTSAPGRIHVSEAFANALKGETAKERKGETAVIPSDSEEGETAVIPSVSEEPFPIPYSLFPRGEMEIKGKGLMTTYWLEGIIP